TGFGVGELPPFGVGALLLSVLVSKLLICSQQVTKRVKSRRRDSMIRLLLADDHRMFREGLRRLLTDQPDMQVEAEAATAVEALEAVRLHHVDVAVLDLSMPGRSGTELIAHVKSMR